MLFTVSLQALMLASLIGSCILLSTVIGAPLATLTVEFVAIALCSVLVGLWGPGRLLDDPNGLRGFFWLMLVLLLFFRWLSDLFSFKVTPGVAVLLVVLAAPALICYMQISRLAPYASLVRQGLIPLRLKPFLRFAADRSLLIKTPIGYRFLHILLRDHLISLYADA